MYYKYNMIYKIFQNKKNLNVIIVFMMRMMVIIKVKNNNT